MNQGDALRLQQAVGDGWRVVDYRDPAGFDWLWRELADGCLSWVGDAGAERNLLIVWSDMPGDLDFPPVNISDQLTPFDWVVSISKRLLNEDKPRPFRVVVLDCHSHARPDAFGCRMADSLVAALPWIAIVRLLPLSNGRSALDLWGPQELRDVIADPHRLVALNHDVDRARSVVDGFVQAWVGNLSRSATHHDVNNLLGPLVLLEGFGLAGESKHRGSNALLQHTRWLGLARPALESSEATRLWFDLQSLAGELGRTVRLLVVDDQANHGWSKVLAAAMGMPAPDVTAVDDAFSLLSKVGKIELWATTATQSVTATLNAALASNPDAGDCRLALQLTPATGSDEQPLEILLLDLRLAQDRGSELRSFQAVAKLASELTDRNAEEGWPWNPLPARSAIGEWIEQYEKTPDFVATRRGTSYLGLLSLLPRVVATMDMSLPVVVFSSTGQRSVVEQFKGFDNILTSFEKPRFSDYRAESPFEEARSGCAATFKAATSLLRARVALQAIAREAAKTMPPPSHAKHVDIFVDESGTPEQGGFTVAGLMLLYPDQAVAAKLDDAMRNKTVDIDGTRFSLSWSAKPGEQLVHPLLDKRLSDNTSDRIRKIDRFVFPAAAQVYKSLNISAVSFALRASKGFRTNGEIDLYSERHLDNLFLDMSRLLLDAAIFEWVEALFGRGTNPVINVYIATRIRTGNWNTEKKKDLFKRFAILTEEIRTDAGVEPAYRSSRPDSWFPMVADVLRNRPHAKKPNMGVTVGVPINIAVTNSMPETSLDTQLASAKMLARVLAVDGRVEVRDVLGVGPHGPSHLYKNKEVFEYFKKKEFGYVDEDVHLKQSHFVADLLAHTAFVAQRDSRSDWYVAKRHFGYRMLDDLGLSGFEEAIDASKRLEAGDRPGAMMRATAAVHEYRKWKARFPNYCQDSLVPLVLRKVAAQFSDVAGREFSIFCRALHDTLVEVQADEDGRAPALLGRPPWTTCVRPVEHDKFDLALVFPTGVSEERARELANDYLTQCGLLKKPYHAEVKTSNRYRAMFRLFGISKETVDKIVKLMAT